jgi:aspartate carbamoyltransferase catalytic subunit
MGLKRKDLLEIRSLDAAEIQTILDTAASMKEIAGREIKKVPALRGKTVVNLFLEPSTRTRTSFEIAGKWLSADVVNVSGSSSSVVKGETLIDTAKNLMAMAPDVIVLRHSHSGGPHLIAQNVDAAVINAGDGTHEHPTQALLDCLTIRKHKKKLEGLEIAICGDISHSRVARSGILALTTLGAKVRVAGPQTMLPVGIEAMGAKAFPRLEQAVEGTDVVMMLRIQKERLSGPALFPNTREYSRYFGLNARMLDRAKPDAIVMHPGPVNRGVELDPSIADGPRSVILDQVTNGVAVRMALLYLLAGGQAGEQAA